METLTIKAKENLSLDQLKIYTQIPFDPGLVVVEAAAGAGKTRTLSFLVLKAILLETVQQVFILTSTRTAKDEAFQRVSKLHSDLGFVMNGECDVLPMRNVRTIHSVCLSAARQDAEDEGEAGVTVVNSTTIRDMLMEILEEIRERRSRESTRARLALERAEAAEDAVAAAAAADADEHSADADAVDDGGDDYDGDDENQVIDLRSTKALEIATLLASVRCERLRSCVDVVDDSFGPVGREALETLNERLQCDPNTSMQSMDFDLMTESYRQSERPVVFPGDVLFVDEAQDLTNCQLGIIMNTLRAGATVVCLGDDSQGIFQFSGSCEHTLLFLKARAREAKIDVKRFSLMKNHRSTNRIVSAAEALLPFHDRANRVGVTGNGTIGDPVEMALFSKEEDEGVSIAARVVDLVSSGQFEPDQIVIIRHKNWTWNNCIIQSVKRMASQRGVDVKMAIMGQDAVNSLEGKFLCVLQVALGIENFCDVAAGTEGLDMVKNFLKAMRSNSGWNQKIGFRAVEAVYYRHVSSLDMGTIFTTYADELVAEFKSEELKDDEEQAKKSNNSKRKRAETASKTSTKAKNFESVVKIAARVVFELRERIRRIERGIRTLQPVAVDCEVAYRKHKPPDSTYPELKTPLGGLSWIIMRDVILHQYEASNEFQIQEIVDAFDLEFDQDTQTDVVEALSASISTMASAINDKSTKGKVVFSTIHKFKGRESDVAFVCGLSAPFGKVEWPRRATLADHHSHSCTNTSGSRVVCCAPFKNGIERLENAQISEKLRLFYVGASRAQKRLFMSGFVGRFNSSFSPLEDNTRSLGVWEKLN